MTIDINENGIATITSSSLAGGGVMKKNVDILDLCTEFAKTNVDVCLTFPKNCRGYVSKNDSRSFLFVYDACKHDLLLEWTAKDALYYGDLEELIPKSTDARFSTLPRKNYRIFNVPFPPLAFIVTGGIENNSFLFKAQYVYALNTTSLPLEKTSYYIYPFTNVFRDSWNCCMGHGIMHRVPIETVDYYPSQLYFNIGNHDLDTYSGAYWNNQQQGPLGFVNNQYQCIVELYKRKLDTYPIVYNKQLGTNLLQLFKTLDI